MDEVGVQKSPNGERIQILVQGSFQFPDVETARAFAWRILELAAEIDFIEYE